MPWRMTRTAGARRTYITAVIGALTLCGAHSGWAQVPWALGRWQGKGTFYLNWDQQTDHAANTKYETLVTQERLWLSNRGAYIVDPRLLTLNLGGSFGGSQEDDIANTTDSPLRVGNGTLYNYAFEGLFMSETTSPVTLFANRDENVLTQGFGTQSDYTFESFGGVWELRENSALERYGLRNFNSLLDAHQEVVKENSSVFGSPNRRDETHDIVRYHAHKGGETSDTDLYYDFNDVHDPLNPTDVYQNNSARAAYSLDFGPTLNRRLDSGAYYFNQSGYSPGTNLGLTEGLHIDHNRDFWTAYRYAFSQSDTDAGVTTTNIANVNLLRRLYPTLTTTADAWTTRQDFSTGNITAGGGRTGFNYRRSLPWNGEFFSDTYGGYQVDDNNFSSSTLQVINEPHTAPDPRGPNPTFTLDNPLVETNTIDIVDATQGNRQAQLGTDYQISALGNYTQIILLGGTFIQTGDLLNVNYTYKVQPDVTYSTTTAEAKFGADFPLLSAWYEHLLSNQARLAGTATPGFLINQNIDRWKLELHHHWDEVRAQSSFAYDILRSTVLDANTWAFDQQLAYQPRPELLAQIIGDQILVDYPGEGRHAESYVVRGLIDWTAPAGITVSALAGYRAYYDTGITGNDIVDAGVRLHWVYQNVEVIPSFTWATYSQNHTDDAHAELRIVRNLF